MVRVQKEAMVALPRYIGIDWEHLESHISLINNVLKAKADL